jgi:hypothetical protein
MDYMLKRWTAFTRFLDDGRICLSNNAAERALRGIALGRKSWLPGVTQQAGGQFRRLGRHCSIGRAIGSFPFAWRRWPPFARIGAWIPRA